MKFTINADSDLIVWLWALPTNHGLWFCQPCNRMNKRGEPCQCGERRTDR